MALLGQIWGHSTLGQPIQHKSSKSVLNEEKSQLKTCTSSPNLAHKFVQTGFVTDRQECYHCLKNKTDYTIKLDYINSQIKRTRGY